MVTPILLNFTSAGGPAVTGYTKVTPVAYDVGQGWGYESAIHANGYVRGINADPRLDSGHEVVGGDVDDFRIDVPVGTIYDVLVVLGDPLQAQDAFLNISDAGSSPASFASAVGANQFEHFGYSLMINSFLRLRLGKAQGAPNTTCVAYVVVLDVRERIGTMRALAPAGTRRLP